MVNVWRWWQILFPWASKSLWIVTAAMKLKGTCSLQEKLWQTHSALKSRDITLLTKFHLVKAMVYFSSHVWMWVLDHNKGWVLKNWLFWTKVLEKTFENSLNYREIKLVNTKGNQSWIFIGRTHAEAEAPVLWPPDVKGRLIGRDPDTGKDWGQEEKWATEDEMASLTQQTWIWASSRR